MEKMPTSTDRWIVTVGGELDVATKKHLAEVAGMLAGSGKPVDFDLSGVTFIDASGWDGVTEAAESLERTGVVARVVSPSAPVRRLQELLATSLRSKAA